MGFAVALGVGLLVGVERERRKGVGPDRAVAGVRTFTIAALLGAACATVDGDWLVAAATLGVALLTA
ncbi:MAG: MgtC/SapB family protein, partial [Rhodospirillales bacterium]|nr:MgtC/SapB family protein [Rhodospirillales bacterium]